MDNGLVIVLTGDGKGKTTSALGMAMRAVGGGMRVAMIQFIKCATNTGEMECAGRLAPDLELRCFGAGFVYPDKGPTEKDISSAREGLAFARQALASGRYGMVILDEINEAVKLGLLSAQEVGDLVRSRPPQVHLVLTGRDAPQELIALADTVTEMKPVKHHYDAGRVNVKGIDC